MSLTALNEQRGRLVTQAREALDEITANTDESRSAELGQRHDAMRVGDRQGQPRAPACQLVADVGEDPRRQGLPDRRG